MGLHQFGDHLTSPLLRRRYAFVEITWDEALQIIHDKFTEIKRDHGPDALAFIASSKCTNEESYLMQKLARAVIGTNNVDNCSRYCQTPATMDLQRTVGYGADSGSIRGHRAGRPGIYRSASIQRSAILCLPRV